MELLLGNELGATYPAAEPKREEPPKPFALPPPNADMRRVYAYLMKQRRVSREVVTHFARSGLLVGSFYLGESASCGLGLFAGRYTLWDVALVRGIIW